MNIHQQALALLEAGDWQAAHRLIQEHADPLACQIHGLLHLIEGDTTNAAYWYGRAGASLPQTDTETEQQRLQQQALRH